MKRCKRCNALLVNTSYFKYRCSCCGALYEEVEEMKRETGYIYDVLKFVGTESPVVSNDDYYGGSGGGAGSSRSWDSTPTYESPSIDTYSSSDSGSFSD